MNVRITINKRVRVALNSTIIIIIITTLDTQIVQTLCILNIIKIVFIAIFRIKCFKKFMNEYTQSYYTEKRCLLINLRACAVGLYYTVGRFLNARV